MDWMLIASVTTFFLICAGCAVIVNLPGSVGRSARGVVEIRLHSARDRRAAVHPQ